MVYQGHVLTYSASKTRLASPILFRTISESHLLLEANTDGAEAPRGWVQCGGIRSGREPDFALSSETPGG